MKTEQYRDEVQEINGILAHITTYKIGDDYYCHISNTDPGATIARASGKTMEEARQNALQKLAGRLKKMG